MRPPFSWLAPGEQLIIHRPGEQFQRLLIPVMT
jgi:hypothetical protein